MTLADAVAPTLPLAEIAAPRPDEKGPVSRAFRGADARTRTWDPFITRRSPFESTCGMPRNHALFRPSLVAGNRRVLHSRATLVRPRKGGPLSGLRQANRIRNVMVPLAATPEQRPLLTPMDSRHTVAS